MQSLPSSLCDSVYGKGLLNEISMDELVCQEVIEDLAGRVVATVGLRDTTGIRWGWGPMS